MSKNKKIKKDSDGYAILLIVLILSSASLVVVTSLLIWGFYFNKTSLDLAKSKKAIGLADACIESALKEIRDDDSYTGTNSIVFGDGSCEYVVSGVSPDITIQSTGTVSTNIRRVRVIIDQVNPQINIATWQEVGVF